MENKNKKESDNEMSIYTSIFYVYSATFFDNNTSSQIRFHFSIIKYWGGRLIILKLSLEVEMTKGILQDFLSIRVNLFLQFIMFYILKIHFF